MKIVVHFHICLASIHKYESISKFLNYFSSTWRKSWKSINSVYGFLIVWENFMMKIVFAFCGCWRGLGWWKKVVIAQTLVIKLNPICLSWVNNLNIIFLFIKLVIGINQFLLKFIHKKKTEQIWANTKICLCRCITLCFP